MANEKHIDALILDAGPILQNSPSISTLLSKSRNIFTAPSIVAEIKDINARKRFETTMSPFITIKTPSQLSIKFVTEFARKTGDLAVLSKADVDIIALGYELDHAEHEGKNRTSDESSQRGELTEAHNTAAASRHASGSPASDPKAALAKIPEATPAAPWAPVKASSFEAEGNPSDPIGHDEQVAPRQEVTEAVEKPIDELQSSLDSLSVENKDQGEASISTSRPVDSSESLPPTTELEGFDSEDSEGWITPANIKRVQAAEHDKSSSKSSSTDPIRTAIITLDFAMQNVILQIGLKLLSPNLNRISNIRTYVLRCHACFQTVKDTSKQFCPRCGKPTLTRVSCSTNAKGEFRIHLKKNMQWNHRGDRYSIPKPVPGQSNGKVGKGKGGGKGGWGQELILAEDQKEYQRVVSSNGRSKGIDLMDEDYLPGILTGDRGKAEGRPKVGAGRNVNSKKRI